MQKRWCVLLTWLMTLNLHSATLNIADTPLFLTDAVSPLTMIVLGRDHKLYYEAYNDAMDLNGNGVLDVSETRFDPSYTYFGYFNSDRCYTYSRSRFNPSNLASGALKTCSGKWSGNFLNYVTTSRIDALRKVLYGGYRSTDSNSTILERAYIPQDAHSWGKEYTSVAVDGYNISNYTPLSLPTGGKRHLFANTTLLKSGSGQPLLRVAQNVNLRIWEWVSIERPVAGNCGLNGNCGGGSINISSSITDYIVRVKVCVNNKLEENCQLYPNGRYKPIGILQEFGENDAMYFGLLSGSYDNNTQGGKLRKNISSITDEINPNNGRLTGTVGIIRSIDNLTTVNFSGNYQYKCGWITTRPINSGECNMWGNPIAEMMYETLRYFAGKSGPKSAYTNQGSSIDNALNLPSPTWQNPYGNNTPYCAKPNMLVISDVNPSYDSDSVPGSYFGGMSDDIGSVNVSNLASTIWANEFGAARNHFIGQSGANYDGAPTAKTVSSFSNIRGLSPEEPTKQGSYYSASIAYYGRTNDINSANDDQLVYSYVVALASPLPEIKINAGGKTVTLVPFAKSVGGCLGVNGTQGLFQPTNTIVDFYVESLTPTSGTFRINFEDVEQGADHDMDAIVKYKYVVNPNKTITITLDSNYAAGCIKQHMGYVISGTTNDGLYLEVRDKDTGAGSDPDYFLDTPPNQFHNPSGGQAAINPNDNKALPLSTSRTFTPGGNQAAATLLKNPLWYAAKWGSFNDLDDNGKPNATEEFDEDKDGTPDNYFLVTNASNLRVQLQSAFSKIVDRSGSFSSASLSSGFLNSTTKIYQAIFQTEGWQGQLLAFDIDEITGDIQTNGTGPNGSLWDAGANLGNLNFNTGRKILTYKPSNSKGIPFRWPSNPASPSTSELDISQSAMLNINPSSGSNDGLGAARLNFLRGDQSQEQQNGGTFRDRKVILGDIIHSSPLLVGPPKFPYPNSLEPVGQAYSDFKTLYANRQTMIYVGSNGGMLHAFDATTGNELFSYVPSQLYRKLNKLTSPSYSHEYYVDGSPNAIDAFFDGAWHTVLVGILKAGGQGVFALDITDPSLATENNADNIVLWEFNDSDDADLGYTFSKPSIVKMANGQWAAVFGNGYNNTENDGNPSLTGNATLYVVNIKTGALIKKFDTQQGMTEDPTGRAKPNGMSTPAVVDINGDGIADYIYAGDLFGNLWKIDVSSTNPSQWDFGFKASGNPKPLFTATYAGVNQPITAGPTVAKVPSYLSQLFIYFGTGKYFEPTDNTDLSVQTIYAIKDLNDGATTISSRASLVAQSILQEDSQYRITSENLVTYSDMGWYMDLIVGGNAAGERITEDIIYRNNKIIFTTLIPSNDPCEYGGSSWLMELNAYSGGRLNYSPFDINGDGEFDIEDNLNYNDNGTATSVPASGIKSEVGLVPSPAILDAGTKEYKYLPGTAGAIQKVVENPGTNANGRQSWRQLR